MLLQLAGPGVQRSGFSQDTGEGAQARGVGIGRGAFAVGRVAGAHHRVRRLHGHDLGLAAKHCQRIVVMQKGRVVESAPAGTLFAAPKEAYTRALIAATPALMKNLDQLRAVYQQQAEEMAS